MSRTFIDQLSELKEKLARLSAMVQQLVEKAVESVYNADGELARATSESDVRINDEEVRIEQLAINLLALHQPAASDLRLITTVIKVNSDLERIADCAVNISQRMIMLDQIGGYEVPSDLRLMANSVVTMLRDTVKAFNQVDENLARHVVRSDDVVDALYHQIVQDMLGRMEMSGQSASVELSHVMIAKNLERIADHCTNIAEDVIYVQSGRIVRHLHVV
jgi:phosphate transport system protein